MRVIRMLPLLATGLVFAGPRATAPPELDEIDRWASEARAEKDPQRKRTLMRRALDAYEERIALRPKDRKLVPRLRRKRAGLLKACGEHERALAEYQRLADGPSRRKDRARAWREAGELAVRMNQTAAARTYLRRVLDDYGDIVAERARALLALGALHEKAGEHKQATRCWKAILDRCRDEVKEVVGAYDRLALQAIRAGDPKTARRWLERCTKRFEKRATKRRRPRPLSGAPTGQDESSGRPRERSNPMS